MNKIHNKKPHSSSKCKCGNMLMGNTAAGNTKRLHRACPKDALLLIGLSRLLELVSLVCFKPLRKKKQKVTDKNPTTREGHIIYTGQLKSSGVLTI